MNEPATTTIKGSSGTLIIHPDRLVIKRGTFNRFMTNSGGELSIHLNKITSVEYKKAGLTPGYLRLHGSGIEHHKKKQECPYTITFNWKKAEWKAAADRINNMIAER